MNSFFQSITNWWSQIDWSATGSMICGIGTCVAIFFAYKIAKKQNELTKQIAEKELKQTELNQKIALYDKRYEIYSLFTQYLFYGKSLSITIKELDDKTNLQILESIYFTNSADRELLTNKLSHIVLQWDSPEKAAYNWMAEQLGIKNSLSKNKEMDSNDVQRLYNKLRNLDYEFSDQQIRKAKMSEFCYPEDISKYVIRYISLLFSWNAYEKKKLDTQAIKECYNEITQNNIISKMKELLKISSDEIQNI